MMTSCESFRRRCAAYHRTSVFFSFGIPRYGDERKPALIPKRSNSAFSTASSHSLPTLTSCFSSSLLLSAKPLSGDPTGYFIRVIRLNKVDRSNPPSRKYPSVRLSASNARTTASMSSTSGPFPSGVTCTVPLACTVTVGKKKLSGEIDSTQPADVAFSPSPSYFSWHTSVYPGTESTRTSISFISVRDSRLNTLVLGAVDSNWNIRVPPSDSFSRGKMAAPATLPMDRSRTLSAASAASVRLVTSSSSMTHSCDTYVYGSTRLT